MNARVLYRLYFACALLVTIVLSMVLRVSLLPARAATDSGSPNLEQDCPPEWNNSTLAGSGPSYDFVRGTTTFRYTVCPQKKSLSHITIELGQCASTRITEGTTPGWQFGHDPTTGLTGIKWEDGVQAGTCKTYTLVLLGIWVAESGQGGLKDGAMCPILYRNVSTVLECEAPTPTNTPTRTNTPTETPELPSSTPTKTATPTNTPELPTNTPTKTATPTDTPELPTNTPTPTVTATSFLGGGIVQGYKFEDENGNGSRDPGEKLLSNWQIVIKDLASNTRFETRTDGDGRWILTMPLPAGDYWVVEVPQAGWRQT